MSDAVLSLSCVGLSHHTSPLEVREAIALSAEQVVGALQRLREARTEEALILSTCNRTEFYTRGAAAADPRRLVRDVVLSIKGYDIAGLDGALYVRHDPDTVRHLFRVACGLDSMVLGESQILGQVKQAAEMAGRADGPGIVLSKMVEMAVKLARRARTETALGEGAVSVAGAGVELARKVFGSLGERRVLVIGAGDTARLAVEHLRSDGVTEFVVANRGAERRERLARDAGGEAVSLDALGEKLAWADLVVTATSAPAPLVSVADVRAATKRRGRRRLVFLDLSVPRDVEPAVNDLPDVFVQDLDGLQSIVESNLDERRKEVPKVEAMIEARVELFLRWHRSLAVKPTVAQFREQVESIRAGELQKYRGRLGEDVLPAVESLTRAIVQKILHTPTTRLRESADDQLGPARVDAIRHLFGLDEKVETRRDGARTQRKKQKGGPGASRDSG